MSLGDLTGIKDNKTLKAKNKEARWKSKVSTVHNPTLIYIVVAF